MTTKINITRQKIGKEDLLMTGTENQTRSGQDVTITGLTGNAVGDLLALEAYQGDTNTPTLPAVDGRQLLNLPSGTNIFTGLIDAPNDYTGDANKLVKVNAAEDAIEFSTLSGLIAVEGLIATNAEAIAGSNNTKIMTSLRVREAIINYVTTRATVEEFVDTTDYTSGTTTELTLTDKPLANKLVTISFDGLVQHQSTYTIAGAGNKVITFDAAIPLGVTKVEAQFIKE